MEKRNWSKAFKKYRQGLKVNAEKLKVYLKGKIKPDTLVEYSGPSTGWNPHRTKIQRKSKMKELRKHRKVRNRIAKKSRRINRLRST